MPLGGERTFASRLAERPPPPLVWLELDAVSLSRSLEANAGDSNTSHPALARRSRNRVERDVVERDVVATDAPARELPLRTYPSRADAWHDISNDQQYPGRRPPYG